MRTLRTPMLVALAAFGLLPACKKKEEAPPEPPPQAQTPPPSEPAKPAEPPPAAEPAKPAETPPAAEPAKAADEVRPPTAADLETYTSDLKGKGPLKAVFETSLGKINCELFPDKAPMTVANFVGLARGLKPFRNPKTNEVEKKPF